jgi:hypothetical protein
MTRIIDPALLEDDLTAVLNEYIASASYYDSQRYRHAVSNSASIGGPRLS